MRAVSQGTAESAESEIWERSGRVGGLGRNAVAQILKLFSPDPLTPAPLRNCLAELCTSLSTLVKLRMELNSYTSFHDIPN